MKKMLSILASLGVAATASSTVVACGETTHKATKFNEIGGIVSSSVTKPDKKTGIIKAKVVVGYKVPEFLTEQQVKDSIGLYTKTTDKNKNTTVTKVKDLTNLKVDFNEPFYTQNLNKKDSKKMCRVEMKITWDVKAKEIVSSATYTVAYRFADSDVAIDLGNITLDYKAHQYPKTDDNKQDQKPQ